RASRVADRACSMGHVVGGMPDRAGATGQVSVREVAVLEAEEGPPLVTRGPAHRHASTCRWPDGAPGAALRTNRAACLRGHARRFCIRRARAARALKVTPSSQRCDAECP